MKTTVYTDSLEQVEISHETKTSALMESAWARVSPILLVLIFMWLVAANFLGWW